MPGVLFLGGFKSDMHGTKATALERLCRKKGCAYLRFDYLGHGESSGSFTDGTIGQWQEDALTVLDSLTSGPQILVGSSMGGWMALMLALTRPERVVGLLGVASAPDFTENLIWNGLSPQQQQALQETGLHYAPSCEGQDPYPITWRLVEEARNHRLLTRKSLPIHCPVRLIHGMQDEDVPHHTSLALVPLLESSDVELTLVKDGNHRMTRDDHIQLLCRTLEGML
jgi:pimeloyl-ACP methyl ester carboxylesterase